MIQAKYEIFKKLNTFKYMTLKDGEFNKKSYIDVEVETTIYQNIRQSYLTQTNKIKQQLYFPYQQQLR